MKYPVMDEAFDTATDTVLNIFEKRHHAKLSNEYRHFMATVGGGYPIDDLVIDFGNNDAVVQVFFGMEVGGNNDVEVVIGRVSHWIAPNSMIPFASEAGGGMFCFALDARADTSVFFVEGFDVLTVASSFYSFLSLLVACQRPTP